MLKDALAWIKISLNVKDDDNNSTTSFDFIVDTSAVVTKLDNKPHYWDK